MTPHHPLLELSEPVRAALSDGRPVVALESTLITHGLAFPTNLEVALAAEARIRDAGAEPATVAVRDGRIRVGLTGAELQQLAEAPGAAREEPIPKLSRQNLAWALGRPGWGGTTVAATMIAAHLARIRVFATGGIGGVHRGGAASMDVSADLEELARTPVLVVCAGPKAILDVALTLEVLETRGVPVVTIGEDEVPGFWSRSSGFRGPARVETPQEAAALATRHWALGLGSGLVVAVPVPVEHALPEIEARRAIETAVAEAEDAFVHGPASTPWLLARVAELTGGRSVAANVALIEHNAGVAAQVATALAARSGSEGAPS